MEQVCPRCLTRAYQVPNMKLMVNTCGHKLCESCIDIVFPHPTASCPECGIILRRNQFRLQQFDDSRVEIEVDIRKKILKDYNKTESDFSTLNDFNDYLEEVETIIYNLSNNTDVEETKAKVEAYKKENLAIISKNRLRQQRHEQVLTTQLAQEQVEVEMRNEEALAKEVEETLRKKKQKESILDDLMYSDLPAKEVLASHIASSSKAMEEECLSGPQSSSAQATQPTYLQKDMNVYEFTSIAEAKPYSYCPPFIETYGPPVPLQQDLEGLGYLESFNELEGSHLGGGFLPAYACSRALQDAFSCLLFFPAQSGESELNRLL